MGNLAHGARPMVRWLSRCLSPPALSRRLLARSVVVFLYHEVSDVPSRFNEMFGLNVKPEIFSRQMDLIRDYFHLLNPLEFLSGDYPTPAALVTFDDGNSSYFRNALPILKEKRVPSIAFLNAGPLRGEICWSGLVTYLQHFEPSFYETRRPRPVGHDFCRFAESEVTRYLDSVDTKALFDRVRSFRGAIAGSTDLEAASGEPLVYFGNHLYNHFNATLLSTRLKEEYWKNQRVIEGLSRGLSVLSYPFSCFNGETTRSLLEEGVQALFAGGGLPNLRRNGPVFHRVECGSSVVTEKDMISLILKNAISAASRPWAASSS